MKLKFICSDVLLPFDLDKHFGIFVYLKRNYNKYKVGMYFGGIDGWEKLTNDIISYIPTSTIYCGYSSDWNNGIRETLLNGVLPIDKMSKDVAENEDGSYSFSISSSEFLAKVGNSSTYNSWWFAIPSNMFISSSSENGDDLIENMNMCRVNRNDMYDDETDEAYLVSVDGKNYKVYTYKESIIPFAFNGSNHQLEITIR